MTGGPRLDELIGTWPPEDLANLAATLKLDHDASAADICECVRWLYHSKVRWTATRGVTAAGELAQEAFRKVGMTSRPPVPADEMNDYPIPGWRQLVDGLAEKLKIEESDPDTKERYICQYFIAKGLNEMTPPERDAFFNRQHEGLGDVVGRPELASGTKGPLRGAAVLTLANAAGFSLYTSSATALSMATSAVGVTLPFAAYTGLSSLLSIATGPVGWLAVGAWLTWRATEPEWEKLAPAIIYIVNQRARPPPRSRRWRSLIVRVSCLGLGRVSRR